MKDTVLKDYIQRLKPHRAPVSRLEVEDSGNYVISCGIDARVVVSGLGTSEMNFVSPNFPLFSTRDPFPGPEHTGNAKSHWYFPEFFEKYVPATFCHRGEESNLL